VRSIVFRFVAAALVYRRRWLPGSERPCRVVLPPYPLALPTLFFATCFAAFEGDVLAVAVTGARALLTACDFGFVTGFFTAAFLTGFGAVASTSVFTGFAGFAAFALA